MHIHFHSTLTGIDETKVIALHAECECIWIHATSMYACQHECMCKSIYAASILAYTCFVSCKNLTIQHTGKQYSAHWQKVRCYAEL